MLIFVPFTLTTVSDDVRRVHAAAIQKAILRSYGTIQAACIDMAVHPANFANELAGERPIRFMPLMNLNAKFWAWYPVFLAMEFGIPEELEAAQALETGSRRMARIEAPMARRSA